MNHIRIPKLLNEADAKKKAADTLSRIFADKMLTIENVKELITDFRKLETQNSVEVFNKIERNITELDSSLKAVDQMIFNMTETSHKHYTFYQSWKQITSPLNEYGNDLEKLMLSKKNISLMSHNLSMYVKIKDQIEELRQLMENDNNIVIVFKQVRYITYLRVALLQRVKTQIRSDKLNNLADHLMCVQEFENEFFTKFWGYFANMIPIAIERPEFLVKLLRLIEEDPTYMTNLRKLFKSMNNPDQKFQGLDNKFNEGFKMSQQQQIRMTESSVIPRDTVVLFEDESESLSATLQDKIPEMINENIKRRFQDKQTREEILDETLNVVNDLYLIKTKVAPCFPPKYNIFEVYKDGFLEHIKIKIKPFLNQEELENTPGLLIPVAHWLDLFDESLRKVGLDLYQTDIISEVTYYMHLFFDHINEVLESNLNSVINKNKEDKQAIRNDKKLDIEKIQSFYATDIYDCLLNVINLLSGDFKGQLMFQVVKTILEKLREMIKNSELEIEEFKTIDDLIIVCIYVNDASRCLEIFPTFKKKVKSLLPKDLYAHIKIRYINSNPSILTMYNSNIRKGCLKIIQLMFLDLEKNYLKNIFTSQWDDEVLLGIFGTFKEYFNTGFYKLLKTQNNLMIIVRTFIDLFVCYYVEELIHSIRTLNRKELKAHDKGHSALVNYQLHFITIDPDEIVYKEKKKENEESHTNANAPIAVKDLDKIEKDKNKVFKKYKFPVKKFKKEDKKYDPIKILERVNKDRELFADFLEGFSDEAKEPFSKHFNQTLGQNFINTFNIKIAILLAIMKCHSSALKEQIIQFKEHYNGEEGKALCEALLYVREDTREVTKSDMKLFLLDAFK